MVRTQTTNGSSTSPKDFAFYFNGIKIGGIGNNGTDNVDYASAIVADGTTPGSGAFRGGAAGGSSFADFDQNWTAINPAAGLEGADSSYTVSAGQTLSSIAAALWGDASLWYLLAQANGLTSDDAVTAGQVLTIPAKVTNFHNSAIAGAITVTVYLIPETKAHPLASIHTLTATSEGDTEYRVPGVSMYPALLWIGRPRNSKPLSYTAASGYLAGRALAGPGSLTAAGNERCRHVSPVLSQASH